MNMDIYDLLRWVVIPLAVLIEGYQFKVINQLQRDILRTKETSLTEPEVRLLLSDKLESLHLADAEAKDRINRLEVSIERINTKLDNIMDILRKPS